MSPNRSATSWPDDGVILYDGVCVLRLFCRVWALLLLLCPVHPALAQGPEPFVLPPSPIGGVVHDVFDQSSGCWVWDGESRGAQTNPHPFSTSKACGGKPLEGEAELTWTGARDGEIWKGSFRNGRLTGIASGRTINARFEVHYNEGLRHGRTVYQYVDGGRLETAYVRGVMDGPRVDIYSEGTRVESEYREGRPSGVQKRYMRDGSRFEFPVARAGVAPRGVYTTADGVAFEGSYTIPRVNPVLSPRSNYPPISQRQGEEGVVWVTINVLEGGTVRDIKLARSSGYPRLDEAAVEWFSRSHYSPGTVGGKPVSSYVLTAHDFYLRPRP